MARLHAAAPAPTSRIRSGHVLGTDRARLERGQQAELVRRRHGGRSVQCIRHPPERLGNRGRIVAFHEMVPTVPAVPSTVTSWPSCNADVPFPVATTAGTPYSRAMIAGCDRGPPVSVTRAPTLAKSTDKTGDVTGQTSTSPARSLPNSASFLVTRTGPV